MTHGTVFDIQHYAVHDGPGIRTLVFLKGCPLRCLWCCNPESQRFAPEIRHTAFRCCACFSCREACPKNAIRPSDGMPVFDREMCGGCDAPCADACPQGAIAMAGEPMTSGQVMARVAADKAFYDHSGGGVTFSGGEPLAQPVFLEDLLVHARRLGIHTAVETCGYADPGAVARCEPLVDLFFFDLKVIDSARHERLTGASNAVILENLRALAAKAPGRLAVRVPLVPGCTDDPDNLQAIAACLRSLGIGKVELVLYHTLGAEKYASFGRRYLLDASQSLSDGAAEEAARVFHLCGISCPPAGASGLQ